jgi:hypothetical protein
MNTNASGTGTRAGGAPIPGRRARSRTLSTAPDMLAADRRRFPRMAALREALGNARVQRVPIPHDCTDGFLGAYWRRPAAYLDPSIRESMSSFRREGFADGVARLAADLESGVWLRRYGQLLQQTALDTGMCLVVADV